MTTFEFICNAKDCKHNNYPGCKAHPEGEPLRITKGGKCWKYAKEEKQNNLKGFKASVI